MSKSARWLNAHIPGWRARRPQEKKAIRDFSVLWSYFELNATGKCGQPNASPEKIIRAVNDLTQEPDITRYETARVHFAERYIAGDDYTENWQHLRMRNDFAGCVRRGLVGEDRTSRGTLLALLLVVNRLRNNFLHGEKARYNFADQYGNFTHANAVLMYALELWPNHQEG